MLTHEARCRQTSERVCARRASNAVRWWHRKQTAACPFNSRPSSPLHHISSTEHQHSHHQDASNPIACNIYSTYLGSRCPHKMKKKKINCFAQNKRNPKMIRQLVQKEGCFLRGTKYTQTLSSHHDERGCANAHAQPAIPNQPSYGAPIINYLLPRTVKKSQGPGRRSLIGD